MSHLLSEPLGLALGRIWEEGKEVKRHKYDSIGMHQRSDIKLTQ
jgi:hypothetical protein